MPCINYVLLHYYLEMFFPIVALLWKIKSNINRIFSYSQNSTLLSLCCNVKYYQTFYVWTHLWTEWLFQQHRRGYVVPLSTVYREKKVMTHFFARENTTLRLNSWCRGSEAHCRQVHHVFYADCQSALLEKTTMRANTIRGWLLASGLPVTLLRLDIKTPNMCAQRNKVTLV